MTGKTDKQVTIIGAGLAGCEAALVLSAFGIKSRLIDAKPQTLSPAHKSTDFAELVCSNSLKSQEISTASGLLKQELRLLGSPLIATADNCSVAAGGALAVDRSIFSSSVTQKIQNDINISIENYCSSGDEPLPLIIASGPLTLPPLSEFLQDKLGGFLHFYDAAAPIVAGDSLDLDCCFFASRYDKGEGEYINCPLTKDEYLTFVSQLMGAQTALKHDFDSFFEGCMPVEQIARRGVDTLRFGPLKPVGLVDKDGRRPYAVVQLRRENAAGSMFNMVGFQTNLTFGEQKRVFTLIPALKNAEFLRFGVMHRNSFVDAPKILSPDFSLRQNPDIFIAGQLSGVEGYCESIMSGHLAALSLAQKMLSLPLASLPATTICGALSRYIATENKDFQPMNANFGLLPPLDIKNKALRRTKIAERAIQDLSEFKKSGNLN